MQCRFVSLWPELTIWNRDINTIFTRHKGARRELLERFRVLASLPLAGTGQRERRVIRVAIPRIKSRPFTQQNESSSRRKASCAFVGRGFPYAKRDQSECQISPMGGDEGDTENIRRVREEGWKGGVCASKCEFSQPLEYWFCQLP